MAQSGYTPIQLYYSSSTGTTPVAGNLVAGELAINTADGKLFYKDSSNNVQVIAGKGGAGVAGGSDTQVQYNSSGSLAGSANMTFSGTALTLANDASISGLTVGKGGGAVASNTVVGASAGQANTTGSNCTAIGNLALYSNTNTGNNTAVGYNSMYLNNGGFNNTAVGVNSLQTNSTGVSNAAFSNSALNGNTTGSYNTGIGNQALYSNTTASNNTAVGYQAGYSNTTGTNNFFAGHTAGYSNTTSSGNTYLGRIAGYSTTGNSNTFVGYYAGGEITTGSKNVVIGGFAGNQGGLDIRTASNYVVLSDGDGNVKANWNSTGVMSQNSSILELATVTAAAPSSTQTFDASTQAVQYFTTNAANNWTLNIRGNSTTTLNSVMAVGQSLSITTLTTQGSTAYYNSAVQIDGTTSGVTTKWQGSAPTSGNASSIDCYTYVVIKTAASTYTVLASQTKFA